MSSTPPHHPRTTLARVLFAALLAAPALAGCATATGTTAGKAGDPITVAAAENFWGSLAAQLGGPHVRVTSIIDNPNADPHDYESTAADGRAVVAAKLVIVNGVGYDTWATKLVDANPSDSRTTLTVGEVVGVRPGDNPHRWYSPGDVRTVIDRITADYTKIDPDHAAFFHRQRTTVLDTNLHRYLGLVDTIRSRYAGTPVGASESIFAMLAPALGLDLRTPEGLLDAVSEGADPTAKDKATADEQISGHRIKVYVYNSQNATPDVRTQVRAATAAGIPVTTITETMTPAGASFQSWQAAQLTALEHALATATGK